MNYLSFHSKIVGTTFIENIPWQFLQMGDVLELEWEKDNPHGPRYLGFAQAVKVAHRKTDAHIGYLPSTGSPTAAIVINHKNAGGECHAIISQITGGVSGKETKGINVKVLLEAPADDLLEMYPEFQFEDLELTL